MNKNEIYTIDLKVKPYILHWFTMNFPTIGSNIVDIRSDNELYGLLTASIRKSSENQGDLCDSPNLKIIISERIFERYGYCLVKKEERFFTKLVEIRIKSMMCFYLSVCESIGLPIAYAIRRFQSIFGFDECIWSAESIRREYVRNGKNYGFDLKDEILKQIDKIFLSNLSRFLDNKTTQNEDI